METLFYQIGLMTIVATLFAFLARYTKQPLIPAYILTGFLLGPAFNLISNTSFIEALSELGIIFLLFLVGLELDLSKLKPIANVAIIGGFAQILFTASIAYLVSTKLGYAAIPSFYFGLIIALSSTMVVVKMLSDKHQLDTAHGRITIGILILQDIVAIAAILFLESTESITNSIPLLILHIVLTFSIIILILHFIAPILFDIAAQMQELLLLLSLSLCFFFTILFQWSGFSMSIGAFIAGIVLANLPYRLEMTSKLRPLRDFFATLFFVSLGMQLSFETLQGLFWPVVIFVLLTLLLKPLILLGICNAFGYTKRSAFIIAISLAQVSEFSLILAAEGLKLGHLNYNMLTIIVLVTMITITLSSYLFNFEYYIYKLILPLLTLMEKMNVAKPRFMLLPKREKWDIILCGFHRMGHTLYHNLKKKYQVLVIDYDPDMLLKAAEEKIPFVYGDATDPDVIDHCNLRNVKIIVSTLPDYNGNLAILRLAKKKKYKLKVILTAQHDEDALKFYEEGASYVILPMRLGSKHIGELISANTNFEKEKKNQIKEIGYL